jgi:acetyl-CoA carboxylase biotin carboxyl carrier protein
VTKDVDGTSPPDQELVRFIWQEARDLIKRLDGTSVRRLSVQAGEYKVEIELGGFTEAPHIAGAGISTIAGHRADATAAAPPDTRLPVVAPLVGTFFRSPQPGAPPFVEEGDVVEPGQTIGIVEAMKIMNQVASEHRGRVAEIAVKDGEWVEFQQTLMYIEPLEAGSGTGSA